MIPKYRAWDKVNGTMHKVAGINFGINGGRVISLAETNRYNNNHKRWHTDVELLQSTGLLDKNGKEIFEGDIVKVKAEDVESKIHSDRYQVGMVIYTYGSFDIQTNDGTFTGLIPESNLTDILLTFEVLGNKFEHPHLLGEE